MLFKGREIEAEDFGTGFFGRGEIAGSRQRIRTAPTNFSRSQFLFAQTGWDRGPRSHLAMSVGKRRIDAGRVTESVPVLHRRDTLEHFEATM